MRHSRTIQAEVLHSALENLKRELLALRKSPMAFLQHYRQARLHAFQLEFLAKFLRRSNPANENNFEEIVTVTKELEDQLGAFNESDEMLLFVQKNQIAPAPFIRGREQALAKVCKWMQSKGWSGRLPAIHSTTALLNNLEPLTDTELRVFAAHKIAKTLNKLQVQFESKEFAPRKKSGYQMDEVESKVHEARRDIRKVPMYAGYLSGVFTLTDQAVKTPLAQSPFAKLPKPVLKQPIKLSRPHFLAVTKYVSDLGFAKDWAHHLAQLQKAGFEGEVRFDHLDPALKDALGRPAPFNKLVGDVFSEIRRTKIFKKMADAVDQQV